MKVGARARVGKGCVVLATLVDDGASLSFTDIILTLVSIGFGAEARMRAVREIEGEVPKRAATGEGEGEVWEGPSLRSL